MPRYTESNKYNATPRKVFDKHVDRMETKRARDKADHRADLKAIFHRIINLEQTVMDLAEHVAQHCLQLKDVFPKHGDQPGKDSNEELG